MLGTNSPLSPQNNPNNESRRGSLVYKSNELIEAQFSLSAAAQKVTAILISQINPKGDDLPTFDLSVPEYARLMGISPQAAYTSIDSVTTELKRLMVTLRKRDSRSFVKLGIFRECFYDDEQKRVWFEFEERLDQHLRDFAGNFTRYQVKQIRRLKSRYAIRLYEILRKAHPISNSQTYSIYSVELADLKRMLGVAENTYPLYSDFRKAILDKSMGMLEKDTDLKYTYRGIRKGRKISLIQFRVLHNPVNLSPEGDVSGEYQPAGLPMIEPGVRGLVSSSLPWLPERDLEAMAYYGKDVLVESVMDMLTQLSNRDIAGQNRVSYFKKIAAANYRKSVAAHDVRLKGKTLEEKLTDDSWYQGDEDFFADVDD